MQKPKSSLIVSPNLGCPEIVSLESTKQPEFRVILAAPLSDEFDSAAHTLAAHPSFDGEGHGFMLEIASARKLGDESIPATFTDVNETRLLISTTLRTEVFPGHAFWEISAKPKFEIDDQYLRVANGKPRSTLYDLTLAVRSEVVGRVRHALCLRMGESMVKFVHL